MHATPLSIPEPDYGIITDAYGAEDTEEEWNSIIGKPPEFEKDDTDVAEIETE